MEINFTPEELDFMCFALIRYQAELRSRTALIERFAVSPDHLANHRAKMALGDKLLAAFSVEFEAATCEP